MSGSTRTWYIVRNWADPSESVQLSAFSLVYSSGPKKSLKQKRNGEGRQPRLRLRQAQENPAQDPYLAAAVDTSGVRVLLGNR